MKIKENVTLYICEHCGKKYFLKYWCEKHEDKCSSNPKNFTDCSFCKFLEQRDMQFIEFVSTPYGEHEEERSITAFWCDFKKHWVYPRHIVNNPIDSSNIDYEIDNEPMPNKCDHLIDKFN